MLAGRDKGRPIFILIIPVLKPILVSFYSDRRSLPLIVLAAWILHTAATVSDPNVRDMLIEQVLDQALTSTQFPSIYDGSGSSSGILR